MATINQCEPKVFKVNLQLEAIVFVVIMHLIRGGIPVYQLQGSALQKGKNVGP